MKVQLVPLIKQLEQLFLNALYYALHYSKALNLRMFKLRLAPNIDKLLVCCLHVGQY